MVATIPGAHLNEQVYDELRTRVLTRRHAPGEKLSLHVLADELGVSRSPVHHALTQARGGRAAHREGPARLLRHAGHGSRARRGLRRPARARAPRRRANRRAARASRARVVPRASSHATGEAISHREWDSRERRLPRAPDRPRRQCASLRLLPRALREPDDAGDPRGPRRGPRAARDRAPRESSRRSRRATSRPRGAPSASTSRPDDASRSRRSSAPAACS